jgi:hypothetical protein
MGIMFTQPDAFSWIFWIILLFLLSFFGPRIMLYQYLTKLEIVAAKLETRTRRGKETILRRIEKRPSRMLRRAVTNFLEFFVIEPVSLDPFGIIRKLEHVINLSEERMKGFVKKIASHLNTEEQANVVTALSAAISLNQISKIVRHYIELIKKTKNLQLALLIQMQIPLIDRISKALLRGTEALTKGWPIGDSIGSLVVAKLIGNSRFVERKDTIICRKRIKGKNVILIKAKGPGSRMGKLGRVVENIVKREKISKIITIDAARKLEGEKTGSIAEGVGVAIGGIGTDRAFIEEIAVKKKIPLDSIVIKMSAEEAIQSMCKEIFRARDNVIDLVLRNITETKGRGKIIVVGVGNTVGIGNNAKEAERAEETIEKVIKIMEERERIEKEKKKWSLSKFFESL